MHIFTPANTSAHCSRGQDKASLCFAWLAWGVWWRGVSPTCVRACVRACLSSTVGRYPEQVCLSARERTVWGGGVRKYLCVGRYQQAVSSPYRCYAGIRSWEEKSGLDLTMHEQSLQTPHQQPSLSEKSRKFKMESANSIVFG